MTTTIEVSLSGLAKWAGAQTWSQFALSLAEQFERKGFLSPKQESALRSMYAKSQAREAKPINVNPVTEVGMYEHDQVIYRVKLSKQGRLYAMRFAPLAPMKSERFVYAKGVINDITADERMTVEQVAKLGLQFGICCVCGAELTDEKSVAQGIGPVCIKKV